MKTIEITGSLRTELGKKSTKQIRKSGNVPCVIYGTEKNIHFQSHENNFKELIFTPDAHLVKLNLDGKEINVVLKDIQYHPVKDNILHIDFMEVFDNKPVTINIPIKVTGDSVGVIAGGKLSIKKRTIKARGLAKDLPEVLLIDITKLRINEGIKVGDLSFKNIELLDMKKAMVLSIATSRVAQKTDAEIEAEEAEAAAATEEGTEETTAAE
jgi:large subunit ribosomal protein L25